MIAGVCLVTWPAKNENINTVNAATETIDGHEYAVINIDQSTSENTTNAFWENQYIKVVLQEDIVYNTPSKSLGGSDAYVWRNEGVGSAAAGPRVLFDLNGHGITVGDGIVYFGILTRHISIYDSSAAGNGYIKGSLKLYSRRVDLTVDIYGGTFTDLVFGDANVDDASYQITYNIYGGSINYLGVTHDDVGPATHVVINGGYVGGVQAGITDITSVIDNVAYQTIYLMGDSDPEQSKIIFKGSQTDNYRYVFLDNWDLIATNSGAGQNERIYGNAIILDYNGHYVNSVNDGGYYFYIACNSLELTDTSTTGGGGMEDFSLYNIQTIIVSGGFVGGFGRSSNTTLAPNIYVRGGRDVRFGGWYMANSTVTAAPYMLVDYTSSGSYHYTCYDDYVVSDSWLVSGVYNYAFSDTKELQIGSLWNLAVPKDKTYYLWGRKADGAYAYLNIIYRDGAWVQVADSNEAV